MPWEGRRGQVERAEEAKMGEATQGRNAAEYALKRKPADAVTSQLLTPTRSFQNFVSETRMKMAEKYIKPHEKITVKLTRNV